MCPQHTSALQGEVFKRSTKTLFFALFLIIGVTIITSFNANGVRASSSDDPNAGPPPGPYTINDFTDIPNTTPPVTLKALSAGHYHACVLRVDGTVGCWGALTGGQIGVDPNSVTESYSIVPRQVFDSNNNQLTNVVEVQSYENRNCALKGDGTVWCWGQGVEQVAPGQPHHDIHWKAIQMMIQPGVPLTQVTKIALGAVSCVVQSTGRALCWGDEPLIVSSQFPKIVMNKQNIAPLDQVYDVTVGEFTVCFLTEQNNARKAWCLGNGVAGGMGNNTYQNTLLPTEVADPVNHLVHYSNVRGIYGSESISCGIDNNGAVACWGGCAFNLWGKVWPTCSAVPEYVRTAQNQVFSSTQKVTVAKNEANYNCALKNDGSVWCWGENTLGQLGDGTRNNSFINPVPVSINNHSVVGMTDLATGGDFSCVIWMGNQVACWGLNGYGVLGTHPQQVPFTGEMRIVKF